MADFVGLVRRGFFDGKSSQRVVPNLVIQGGSPSPLGSEAQGFMLRAEITTIRSGRDSVGMSRGDLFNSGDSPLFVTNVQALHLDGAYTLFGHGVSGFGALAPMDAGDLILKPSVKQRDALSTKFAIAAPGSAPSPRVAHPRNPR